MQDQPSAIEILAAVADFLRQHAMPQLQGHTAFHARVAANVRAKPPQRVKVTREDWLGAFTSFWLVVVTTFPAAVPFMLIDEPRLALRVSNAVLLLLLFVTGYWWARHTLSRPWLVGTVFLVIGMALVVAAIALGG